MWNDLTMQQRADVISMAIKAGMRDMKSIRSFYDETSRSRRFEDGGSTKASIPILSSTPKLKFDAPVIEKVRPEYEEIKPKEEIPVEPIKTKEPIIPGLSPQQPISDSRFSRSHPIFKDEYDYMNSDAFLTRVKKMTNDNEKARILATNMRNNLYHTNLPNKAFYDYTSNSKNSGFRLSESGPYMHKIYYGRVNDVPGFTKRSVIAHELGHSVYDTNIDGSLLDYHLLSPQYTSVLQRGRYKTLVDDDTRRHDHMDGERIADIRALQQQAKDAGIWDKTTGVDMTPEMYNKLKQTYPEHRSFDMWNDEDLRWLINTTAQNNTPTLDDSNGNYLLANGGHLFEKGGIKKYTGDLEDITYDADNMKFYEKATGKELGDSAILDEIIINGKDRVKDYLTEANDNTSVYNVPHREYNLHLKDRAEQGARQAAIWREEHPNMSAWGDAAASVPLAVASVPLIAGGAEALAGTSAGQAVSSGLLSLSNLAKGPTIAGAPAWAWADAGLTSAFAAHGIDELSKGNVTPEALLEVAPLGQLAKPLYKGVLKSEIRQYNPRHVIKQITAENATSITPEQWTAAQDAAIARGDMTEAQRLRDLHFKVSAPKTEVVDINGNPQLVVHKTPNTFTVFDNNRSIGKLNWFATPNAYGKNGVFATGAGKNPRTIKLYVNMRNAHKPTIDEGIEPAYINQGEDGILGIVDKGMTNYFNTSRDAGKGFMMSGGVDNPNALKSADAVTYDNNGVRIPLGKRDDFNINDIRYGLLPFGIGLTGLGLVNEE